MDAETVLESFKVLAREGRALRAETAEVLAIVKTLREDVVTRTEADDLIAVLRRSLRARSLRG